MSRPGRKAEIEACRAQGAADRDAGLSRNRYRVYQDMNENHKRDGWDLRDQELVQRQEFNADRHVYQAIEDVHDPLVQIALERIFDYVKEKTR